MTAVSLMISAVMGCEMDTVQGQCAVPHNRPDTPKVLRLISRTGAHFLTSMPQGMFTFHQPRCLPQVSICGSHTLTQAALKCGTACLAAG